MEQELFINEIAKPLVQQDAQIVRVPVRDLSGLTILLDFPTSSVEPLINELTSALASAAMIHRCQPRSHTEEKFLDLTLDVVSVGISYAQDDRVVCVKVVTTDNHHVLLEFSAQVFDGLLQTHGQHKTPIQASDEQ